VLEGEEEREFVWDPEAAGDLGDFFTLFLAALFLAKTQRTQRAAKKNKSGAS
jgi:hypothetical protein